MNRRTSRWAVVAALVLATIVSGAAQTPAPSIATPYARDPRQPVDEAYTNRMKEYTTARSSRRRSWITCRRRRPCRRRCGAEGCRRRARHPSYSQEVYQYLRMVEKASRA